MEMQAIFGFILLVIVISSIIGLRNSGRMDRPDIFLDLD